MKPHRSRALRRWLVLFGVVLLGLLPSVIAPGPRGPAVGIVVGPVFNDTRLARFWDLRAEPRPDSVVVAPTGFESRTLGWSDPNEQEKYAGLTLDVHWTDAAHRHWPRVSVCQLVRELYDNTKSLALLTDWDASDLEQGSCVFADPEQGGFVYSGRRLPERCGREAFVVAKYPLIPTDDVDLEHLGEAWTQPNRQVQVLKRRFAQQAELLPSPQCLARETSWGRLGLLGVACTFALTVVSVFWLRARVQAAQHMGDAAPSASGDPETALWWEPQVLVVEPDETIRRELVAGLTAHRFTCAAYRDLSDLLAAPAGLSTAHTLLISGESEQEIVRARRAIHECSAITQVVGVVPDAGQTSSEDMLARTAMFSRSAFTLSSLVQRCRAGADEKRQRGLPL